MRSDEIDDQRVRRVANHQSQAKAGAALENVSLKFSNPDPAVRMRLSEMVGELKQREPRVAAGGPFECRETL